MKENLFIDANAFLYFLTKEKSKWKKVKEIFDSEIYDLYTNVIVLNEVKFKLLWLEASNKLSSNKKYGIVKNIKKDADLRKLVYVKYLNFYINLIKHCEILSCTKEDELFACVYSNKLGLLPTDASIMASMKEYGIKKILTDDKDFREIEGIEVVEMRDD